MASQTIYVDKSGDDCAGTGSFSSPFLTIQRALDGVLDASSVKRYMVQLGPGVYEEPVRLKSWVFIQGSNRKSCVLALDSSNLLGSCYPDASLQEVGISNCTITGSIVVDFFTPQLNGPFSFYLYDALLSGADFNVTGNSTQNSVFIQNIQQISNTLGITHRFCDLPILHMNDISVRSNNIIINSTSRYSQISRIGPCFQNSPATFKITGGTPILSVNSVLFCQSFHYPGLILEGIGVAASGTGLIYTIMAPDSDTDFVPAGAQNSGIPVVSLGENWIIANPTAPRVFRFHTPGIGTRFRIKNQSLYQISMAPTSNAPGSSLLIPPLGYAELCYVSPNNWFSSL